MKFQYSKIAHKYLGGLSGVEIGGSAHNPFGLNTVNVDFTDDMDTIFKKAEEDICGEKLKVDVVADASKLPFGDNSYDFVISSHVIEHVFDPIGTLREWIRVVKPGGYIFTIAPLKEFTPGETRPITKLSELIDRCEGKIKSPEQLLKLQVGELEGNEWMTKDEIINILNTHHTVFDLNLFVEMCDYIGLKTIETLDRDDKVGNGFCVVNKVK